MALVSSRGAVPNTSVEIACDASGRRYHSVNAAMPACATRPIHERCSGGIRRYHANWSSIRAIAADASFPADFSSRFSVAARNSARSAASRRSSAVIRPRPGTPAGRADAAERRAAFFSGAFSADRSGEERSPDDRSAGLSGFAEADGTALACLTPTGARARRARCRPVAPVTPATVVPVSAESSPQDGQAFEPLEPASGPARKERGRADLRRTAERHLSEPAEGITTRHAFSFAGHYDPKNTSFGALPACNEETLAPGAGYEAHRHSET